MSREIRNDPFRKQDPTWGRGSSFCDPAPLRYGCGHVRGGSVQPVSHFATLHVLDASVLFDKAIGSGIFRSLA